MEKELNVERLLEDLVSPDLEKELKALDTSVALVKRIVSVAVETMRVSPDPLLVAERLVRFGSVIMMPLKDLYQESQPSKNSILSALLLLQLGSEVGVPLLLEYIETETEYTPLIVAKLAASRIIGTSDKILTRLNKLTAEELVNPQFTDVIVALLFALEKLEVDLPIALKQRLVLPQIPWQIRSLLQNKTTEKHTMEQ